MITRSRSFSYQMLALEGGSAWDEGLPLAAGPADSSRDGPICLVYVALPNKRDAKAGRSVPEKRARAACSRQRRFVLRGKSKGRKDEFSGALTEFPSCSHEPRRSLQIWSSNGKKATLTGQVDLEENAFSLKFRPRENAVHGASRPEDKLPILLSRDCDCTLRRSK